MTNGHRIEISSAPLWTEAAWPGDYKRQGRPAQLPDFQSSGVSTPAVNIAETATDIIIEMVAPGMKKEAFKVSLQEDVLSIAYEHDHNLQGARADWNYRVREYNYHSFLRSFYLPEIAQTDGIRATYIDGILTLTIPKKAEAVRRRIDVL